MSSNYTGVVLLGKKIDKKIKLNSYINRNPQTNVVLFCRGCFLRKTKFIYEERKKMCEVFLGCTQHILLMVLDIW